MMNKRAILDSYFTYVKETRDNLKETLDILQPLNSKDYMDFKVLLDYLNNIISTMEDSYSVRELMDLVDVNLLYETWEEDVYPYFSDKLYKKDAQHMLDEVGKIGNDFELSYNGGAK